MKFPSHILLDLKKPTTPYTKSWLSYYWSTPGHDNLSQPIDGEFQSVAPKTSLYIKDCVSGDFITRFRLTRSLNKRVKKFCTEKFTVNHLNSLSLMNKQTLTNLSSRWTFIDNTTLNVHSNPMWTLFDINFIRKDFLYTKLKYSRSPQHDIVSGGVAALFAGFIGFLISEKFGIELVDSADFYTGFMYVVFLSFAIKAFFKGFGEIVYKEVGKEIRSIEDVRLRTFIKYAPKTFYLEFYTYITTIYSLLTRFMLSTLKPILNSGSYSIRELLYTTYKTEYWSVVYRRCRLIKRFLLNYGRLNFDFNHLD